MLKFVQNCPTKIKIYTNQNQNKKEQNKMSQAAYLIKEKIFLLIMITVNLANSIH
jgi:hypothetical protein